jgi:oligoribonuclease NrnB/cAMP/cGMP phosphodiesterase (DHH superfamily)
MATYIIHHQDADGYFGGYAAYRHCRWTLDKIHMVPVQYGDRMAYVKNFVLNELVSGDLAYFLDFSYPRETHDELHARGVKQVILDHHKTAEEDLKGLDYAVFDMSKSGALLAWEYFFQDREPPELCMAVNRLDLRKDVTDDDLAISEYLYQNGFLKPDQWDRWKELCGDEAFKGAIEQGRKLLQFRKQEVERESKRPLLVTIESFKEYRIGWLSVVTPYISDVGAAICDTRGVDAVAMFFFIPEEGKFVFSLRAGKGTDFDCGAFAKAYQGGGHAKAAAFSLPAEKAGEFLQKLTSIGVIEKIPE